MWGMSGIVGLFALLILIQILFEGMMAKWIKRSFHRHAGGKFTAWQRLSQIFLILVSLAVLVGMSGIAIGLFPVP